MSGVILRCPHCGTSQSAPGECDACHEASVKFFCTNHEPGLWLESESCGRCGARFGVPAPAPRMAPPPPRPTARPTAERERRPPPVESDPGSWVTDEMEAPTGRGSGRPGRPDPMGLVLAMIAAAARARGASGGRSGRDPAPRRRRGGGCIGTLFVLGLLIFILFMILPALLGAFLGFG